MRFNLDKYLLGHLKNVDADCNLRNLVPIENQGRYCVVFSQKMLNFSSNDYLGLSLDKRVIDATAVAGLKGSSSTASRLISGNYPLIVDAEEKLSQLKKSETSLVFNSGYAANCGIIASIISRDDFVFADKLVHASIIDGIILSRASFSRFKHNDLNDLEKNLRNLRTKGHTKKILVAVEGIYSMDGDKSDLIALKEICQKYSAIMLVDEAHSTGIYGENGEGLAYSAGLVNDENSIVMSTCSKALGNFGAFFSGSKIKKDFFVNRARSFIYTTALPPSVVGGIIEACNIVMQEGRGRELLKKAAYAREKLSSTGYEVIKGDSPIIPIIVGESSKAVKVQKHLMENGIYAPAVRVPTVEENKARIRITVSSLIEYEDIDYLCKILY